MKVPERTNRMKVNRANNRDGVALIIVLGLLSVMTLLAVAFAIAMRVERLAARNYANHVRAKSLLNAGMVRAYEEIDDSISGMCYPKWDVTCMVAQAGDEVCGDIMQGEASNMIPRALLYTHEWDNTDYAGALDITNLCGWSNMTVWLDLDGDGSPEAVTNGRIAWHAVNVSGLLDANFVGGDSVMTGVSSYLSVSELDLSHLSELGFGTGDEVNRTNQFFEDRDVYHIRYEMPTELAKCNLGINYPGGTPEEIGFLSNLFVYSYDDGRDLYCTDTSLLGRRDCPLEHKWRINAITNYDCWNDGQIYNSIYKYKDFTGEGVPLDPKYDADFMPEWFEVLRTNYLMHPSTEIERPTDVAWNIVNWLDPDRVPQGDDQEPWMHTEGGEGVPLINEVVLVDRSGTGVGPYQFYVEYWFPYVPRKIQPSDNFYWEIGVYTNGEPTSGIIEQCVTNPSSGPWNFLPWQPNNPVAWAGGGKLENMEFGDTNQFFVAISPPLLFPDGNSLGVGGNAFHIKALSMVKEVAGNGAEIARYPTDGGICNSQGANNYRFGKFTQCGGWQVNDPRTNGKRGDWHQVWFGTTLAEMQIAPEVTLGAMNYNNGGAESDDNCDPWLWEGELGVGMRAGLPMFCKDGLMDTIGELGYVFRSNVKRNAQGVDEGGDPGRWQTFDLMNRNKGAYLMDVITTRHTNAPSRGLVCINTRQRETLYTLFHNMQLAYPDQTYPYRPTMLPAEIDNIIDAIERLRPETGWISYTNMFDGVTDNYDRDGNQLPDWNTSAGPYANDSSGGELAAVIRKAAGNSFLAARPGEKINDKVYEDPVRQICEQITFRQNMFLVTVAAQVLGPDQETPVGEARGTGLIVRDSYTGRHFMRFFKWLGD